MEAKGVCSLVALFLDVWAPLLQGTHLTTHRFQVLTVRLHLGPVRDCLNNGITENGEA